MEGATRQGMQAAWKSCKRQDNRFSPRASRKEYSPTGTLVVAQWDPFQTSVLRNYSTFVCFKPLNLWHYFFFTAAMGNYYSTYNMWAHDLIFTLTKWYPFITSQFKEIHIAFMYLVSQSGFFFTAISAQHSQNKCYKEQLRAQILAYCNTVWLYATETDSI